MKINMDKNLNNYTDEVVYDLINFLNQKMDSDKPFESWYSALEPRYGCSWMPTTKIGDLYENGQRIWYVGDGIDIDLVVLDNNKVLVIDTDNSDDYRIYFSFRLYSDADQYTIRAYEEDGKTNIEIEGKGEVSIHKDVETNLEISPDKKRIVDLVRPISFDQIIVKGYWKRDEPIYEDEKTHDKVKSKGRKTRKN